MQKRIDDRWKNNQKSMKIFQAYITYKLTDTVNDRNLKNSESLSFCEWNQILLLKNVDGICLSQFMYSIENGLSNKVLVKIVLSIL